MQKDILQFSGIRQLNYENIRKWIDTRQLGKTLIFQFSNSIKKIVTFFNFQIINS